MERKIQTHNAKHGGSNQGRAHIQDAPDELEDVEALPSLLTFINKEPPTGVPASTSSVALNKRGSKRANALVGNATAKRSLPSHIAQASSSSRELVSSSRSLSLPGYQRDSALNSSQRQHLDEVSSNRSVGAGSDNGRPINHLANQSTNQSSRPNAINSQQQSQPMASTQSRIDMFRQISNNAQQKNKKRTRVTSSSHHHLMGGRHTAIEGSQLQHESIASHNPPSRRGNTSESQNYANTFIYSEYSNCSSVQYDENSQLMSDDDTFLHSSRSNSTFESFNSSNMAQRDSETHTEKPVSGGVGGGVGVVGGGVGGGVGVGGGSLFSMVQGRCPPSSSTSGQTSSSHDESRTVDISMSPPPPAFDRNSSSQQSSVPAMNLPHFIHNAGGALPLPSSTGHPLRKEESVPCEIIQSDVTNSPNPRCRSVSWSSIQPTSTSREGSGSAPGGSGGGSREASPHPLRVLQGKHPKCNDIIILSTLSSDLLATTPSTPTAASTPVPVPPAATSIPATTTHLPAPPSRQINSDTVPTSTSRFSSEMTGAGSASTLIAGDDRASDVCCGIPRSTVSHQLSSSSLPSVVNSRTVVGGDVSQPRGEGEGEATERHKEEMSISSMCFALEGRVTSIIPSRDGSFLLVAFATGLVKVYELNFGTPFGSPQGVGGGNNSIDLEDRYGHQLGTVASSSVSGTGTFRVHLEMSEASDRSVHCVEGAPKKHLSTHVFAGARLGSTRMMVADLLTLQRLKQKRGFITLAGGGVKTFVHSDSRLRGFSSLSSVSYEVLRPADVSSDRRGADDEGSAGCDAGYRAVYRVLCGGGYGTFTLWQVCLEAIPVSVSSSNTTTNATPADGSIEAGFRYKQRWEVMHSGSVNARTMMFGLVLAEPSGSSSSSDGRIEFFVQGIQKDARMFTLSASASATATTTTTAATAAVAILPQYTAEVVESEEVRGDEGMAVSPPHVATTQLTHLSKGQSFRGVTNVLAGSADGMVLFAGCDELIVYRMRRCSQIDPSSSSSSSNDASPKTINDSTTASSIVVDQIDTFSLSELVSYGGGQGPSRRGGRHLRQIEEVQCTSDGQYAIIRCSDNAVVLYSCLDVFGVGIEPCRSDIIDKGSGQNRPRRRSVLTLWYQVEENYGIKLNISYAASGGAGEEGASDNIGGIAARDDEKLQTFMPPAEVILLTSWWPLCSQNVNLHKGGVLKADRLSSFTTHSQIFSSASSSLSSSSLSSSSSSSAPTSWKQNGRFLVPVPLDVTRRGVGIMPASHGGQKSKSNMFSISSSSDDDIRSVGGDSVSCWLCKCICVNKRLHWPEFPDEEEDDDALEERQDDVEDEMKEVEDDVDVIREGQKSGPGGDCHEMGGGKVVKRRSLSYLSEVEDDDVDEGRRRQSSKNTTAREGNHRRIPTRKVEPKMKRSSESVTVSAPCSTACALTLRGVQTKLVSVEADLNASRDLVKEKERECRILVRKFDRRFEIEKQSRREWILERCRLESKVAELQRGNMLLEAKVVDMTQAQTRVMSGMQQIFGGVNATSSLFNSMQTFGVSSSSISSVSNSPSVSSRAPFCVVCQAHTADTMILNCGHMCLCYDHALLMQANHQLDVCPLCKKDCVQICRANGYM